MPPDKIVRQPVYQQLNTILKAIIAEEGLVSGDRFLSEREICSRYDVSRATANKAICSLVTEGVLVYKKGVGTFLADKPLQYDLSQLISFSAKAEEAGKAPSTKVLVFDAVAADSLPPAVRTALRPEEGERVYYFERLRYADSVPVIYEKRYLRSNLIPSLDTEQLRHSLYALIERKTHLKINSADQTISAVTPGAKEANLLDIPPSTACFCIKSTGFLDNGHPLWYETTLYRGDIYVFSGKISNDTAFLKGVIHDT